MKTISERDQTIYQMCREGRTYSCVGAPLHLSRERVRQILREVEVKQSLIKRRARLKEKIRLADDPDKLWAVDDLLDAFDLITWARNRLREYFAKQGREQISLRELMDLAYCDAPETVNDRPLLIVRGVFKTGYLSVVNELTNTDLGKRCNREWRSRVARMKPRYPVREFPSPATRR